MTLAELIALARKLSAKSTRRIGTADRYLLTLAKCSGGLCPTDRARYEGPAFEARVKAAANTLVYRNDLMNVLGVSKSFAQSVKDHFPEGGLQPLATFDAVYTSIKQDRDDDVLHPDGGEVDPKMPVLWQHDPTQPIGKHLEVLSQDKTKILGRSAIADTALGRDAAYLAEFGALRISHGFRPREFAPIIQKNGSQDVVSGFDVTRYEMMEVSLVSVPSNTDAVVEAFSRGKLTSPVAKSWAVALDGRRRKFFTTGFGTLAMRSKTVVGAKTAAPSGVKRRPLPRRKDTDATETALADAFASIVHSGDYGRGFYRAGEDEATVEVWWTMADGDGAGGQAEDGTPYTSSEDIHALLSNVAGVSKVEIGDEADPAKNEGWKMLYPDVQDWSDSGDAPAQSSEPKDDAPANEPAAGAGDDGKGGKIQKRRPANAPKKDGDPTPVSGSFEHIAESIAAQAGDYLRAAGIEVPDGYAVCVEATYADSVIVRVAADDEGTDARYFRVGYSAGEDGAATLSGTPEPVELQRVVGDAQSSDSPTDSNGSGASQDGQTPPAAPSDGGTPPSANGAKPTQKGAGRAQWVKKGTAQPSGAKGKIGKKDMGLLKEAVEHFDDAMKRDGMPTVCKTLIKRGMDLVGDVIKSDGQPDPSQNGQGDAPGAPASMSNEERALWSLICRAMKSRDMSKTALAALLSELAGKLEKDDIDALMAAVGK